MYRYDINDSSILRATLYRDKTDKAVDDVRVSEGYGLPEKSHHDIINYFEARITIKSEAEYRSKKEQVISKFKKEFFKENYNYDQMFHNIVELLIRDVNPYEIIERLIDDRKVLIERTIELMNYNVKPIINLKK